MTRLNSPSGQRMPPVRQQGSRSRDVCSVVCGGRSGRRRSGLMSEHKKGGLATVVVATFVVLCVVEHVQPGLLMRVGGDALALVRRVLDGDPVKKRKKDKFDFERPKTP